MKMNKYLIYILSIISAACVITALAFSAMDIVIFDESRFEKSYRENELYDFIDVEKNDLHEITSKMLDYLKGNRNDLIMYADINGKYQQVFGEREILHMEDVQYLFLTGMKIRNISAVMGIILLAVLFIFFRKKVVKPLCKSYLWVMCIMLIIAIVLGIIMILDFNALFLKFHHIFFDNDLWLLDINTDVLIQMLPEAFFNKMAVAIIVYMAVFIIIPAILSVVYLVLDRKKHA